MEKFDDRVDAYIARSAEFAQPILSYLRSLIHLASPEVRETIKWGMPHFDHKGNVCSFAAFKQHCSLTFHKASLLNNDHGILEVGDRTAMGHLGQIRSLSDLPAEDILMAYVIDAVRLNEEGVKVASKPKAIKKELHIPDYFISALQTSPRSLEQFNNFSYSHQKEYVEWVTEAKTEATRAKRLTTTVEWLAEGKTRMWKYVK